MGDRIMQITYSLVVVWILCFLAGSIEASERQYHVEIKKVDEFHEALIHVMQSPNATEREKLLFAKVKALYDVVSISRISVGRAWRSLADSQKDEFVALLTELIVATYSDRFREYDEQYFELLGTEPINKGVIIKTSINKRNDQLATLNYYFRGDQVFNVVANGISDLSLRRAEYGSIIKEQGYDQLVKEIKNKTNEIRASY